MPLRTIPGGLHPDHSGEVRLVLSPITVTARTTLYGWDSPVRMLAAEAVHTIPSSSLSASSGLSFASRFYATRS